MRETGVSDPRIIYEWDVPHPEDRAKAGAFVAAIAYRKGAAVTLVGLKTQELNGQGGVVVKELSAATGRIGVKLASRRVVAVRPANLSRT